MMDEPKPARPFERLARLRSVQVEHERQRFAAAQDVVRERRAELSEAKRAQRGAERRASSGLLRATGEGSTAALEAVLVTMRRVLEVRASWRAARATLEECRTRLEAERAAERAAQQVALERTHAMIRWREQREQELAEEAFRSLSL